MVLKNFRINLVLRVLLLTSNVLLLGWLIFRTNLVVSTVLVSLLLIYQTWALIRYVDRTNRDLSRFFEAIRYGDFSQTFHSHGLGKSFKQLHAAFGEVMREFQKTRAAKEEHFRYLQTILQHVGIGLIAFQHTGEVELINRAAKRLLNFTQLKNIQELAKLNSELVKTLLNMRSGQKALVKIQDRDEQLQLALFATEFRMRGKNMVLVSIQNIHSELEETEIEAWQKLIRVLTHEIMNSVTPIASLASTVNELLKQISATDSLSSRERAEVLKDICSGLQTIQKRSEGLMHFVEVYRNLTRLPRPDFKILSVKELFGRLEQLMRPQMEAQGITFQMEVTPENLEVMADAEMLEQVLINLLKNAMQALDGQPGAQIKLLAKLSSRGQLLMQVIDNGPGIPADALDKIFIPFFTTRKEGSGIGLSLSRQIMRLHKGSISVQSTPHVETVFTLRF
ncbi:MAG: ATP-binding protein [Calditrichaeota bacterium]|nr:MAG: ATP-binding protein [Calditrichota bacterium]